MAGSRKASIALVVGIGVIACAGRAHAQALAPPPGIPVEITAPQPGSTVTLLGPQGEIPCGERCALNLPQSLYRLVVRSADGSLSKQKLFIRMPMSATVTPPDRGTRTMGIVIMAVGLAGVVVGSALLAQILGQKFVETISQDCAGPCMNEDVATSRWILAGASLGAGLAIGATGLYLFRKHSHAIVDTSAPGAPPARDARLRLTPAAGPRWAGLGLNGSF